MHSSVLLSLHRLCWYFCLFVCFHRKTVGGLQPFFPSSILSRLKPGDLRKHAKKALEAQSLDLELEDIRDIQLKYLNLVSEFPSLGGARFRCIVSWHELCLLMALFTKSIVLNSCSLLSLAWVMTDEMIRYSSASQCYRSVLCWIDIYCTLWFQVHVHVIHWISLLRSHLFDWWSVLPFSLRRAGWR